RDEGNGIHEQDLPYIYDRFYQSAQTKDSNKLGTGLGLSIVKRILDLHKSELTVTSKPEHGTTFRFSLPSAPNRP
ncbi:MAG: ATP-binding protein, partial [Pseudomonadota bacterium]